MILAIGGKFCSGKTEVCEYLVKNYHFVNINFADKLKEIATEVFGMKEKNRTLLQKLGSYGFGTVNNFVSFLKKNNYKNDGESMKLFRTHYQDLFGKKPTQDDLVNVICNGFRSVNENIWVEYVLKKIHRTPSYNGIPGFCIGDVRFKNEVRIVSRYGVPMFIDCRDNVRFQRYKNCYGHFPSNDQIRHISEQVRPEFGFLKRIDNNKTTNELTQQIDELCQSWKLKK